MAILKAADFYFWIQLMYLYRATSDVINIPSWKGNSLLFNYVFCNTISTYWDK